ncbi:hypothetical protein TNCV_3195901 [Trichonephila clavipes]|nr:hypothetical protein TNCV_3195901 [Trichonephila clavipes]
MISEVVGHTEQRLCVKFCFLLGKQLQRPFGFFDKSLMASLWKIIGLQTVFPLEFGIISTEDVTGAEHRSIEINDENVNKCVIDEDR